MEGLAGRRIVVTRRPGQASRLTELLEQRGAHVVEVPSIEIVPVRDPAPLDEALRALERYQWLVFTSANAVGALLGRLVALGLEPRLTGRGPRIASVGPATTTALAASFPADRVSLEPASEHRAAGLVQAFASEGVRGARVFVPASSRGRGELAAGLHDLGAQVEVAVAYETVVPGDLDARVRACIDSGFDLVAFASPSAVDGFASAAGERVRGLRAAVIGPTTAQAAEAAGFDVCAVASPSTVEALVAAVETALG